MSCRYKGLLLYSRLVLCIADKMRDLVGGGLITIRTIYYDTV